MEEESPDIFAGSGEMCERLRAFDWNSHPLGPPQKWPQSLKMILRVMLNSRYQMFVWWGPQLWNFYNDAYSSILGQRHPQALVQPAAQIWKDIWPVIGPQIDQVLRQGIPTWSAEVPLIMERNGYPEEMFATYSYSPLTGDDGKIAGVFCACNEDTVRVLGERRMGCLRQLGNRTANARTVQEACTLAASALSEHSRDISFALLYLVDSAREKLELTAQAGIAENSPHAPKWLPVKPDANSSWPAAQAFAGSPIMLDNLGKTRALPGGAWPEPTETAMVFPLIKGGSEGPMGVVVLGASPRRAFDDSYRGFFDLVAGGLSNAISNARAFEEEKRRVEMLAELDRAKTVFFSNVSHEFRTPLTLMLGPLEEVLAKKDALKPADREELNVAHRNGLRLLKLVNTLLDFSRIEAGRIQASFEPTGLGSYTMELASVFRSAVERAGIKLVVDCEALPELVYVDRDMWEKIVFNLMSNAFKYTFKGEIRVSLKLANDHAELSVRDTGIGIPKEELPKIFDRFHRVEGAKGRTHEGTGIGLSLVQELVKLHGGTVRAESAQDAGSTFTISLPFGKNHLPADRVRGIRVLSSTVVGAAPFIEEASRWAPDSSGGPKIFSGAPDLGPKRGRILLADDNADMCDYVSRLLSSRYQIEVANDGQAALAAARANPPDLILTDVMMPHLDGFGLLRELRANPATRAIPVILLSARAGEESRVEGIKAGADDYLIKPFSSLELLARVDTHIQLAKVRLEAKEALQKTLDRERDVARVVSEINSRNLERAEPERYPQS